MSERGMGPEDAGLVLLLAADEQDRPLADVARDIVEDRNDRARRRTQ